MKNVLKFSGAIAFVLGLVAFILMMATPAATYTVTIGGNSNVTYYAGTLAIFGGDSGLLSYNLAWSGLLGWIFTLVAMLLAAFGAVLPLIKVKALEGIAGILNLVAIGLFAVGGVFLFFTAAAFHGANDFVSKDVALGVGWVFAGIFDLAAAGFAALPVVMGLLKK